MMPIPRNKSACKTLGGLIDENEQSTHAPDLEVLYENIYPRKLLKGRSTVENKNLNHVPGLEILYENISPQKMPTGGPKVENKILNVVPQLKVIYENIVSPQKVLKLKVKKSKERDFLFDTSSPTGQHQQQDQQHNEINMPTDGLKVENKILNVVPQLKVLYENIASPQRVLKLKVKKSKERNFFDTSSPTGQQQDQEHNEINTLKLKSKFINREAVRTVNEWITRELTFLGVTNSSFISSDCNKDNGFIIRKEKIFECLICSKKFVYNKTLQRHMEKSHQDVMCTTPPVIK